MKRWTGWIVAGVMALAVGAALVIHPWSQPGIPPASEYSSVSDLARDLNEQGLGCDDPTPLWTHEGTDESRAPLACSVVGRPMVLDVVPLRLLRSVINGFQPKLRFTNLQDWADDMIAELGASTALELFDVDVDAILVGPNWTVEPRQTGDSVPVLSAIRDEIGGTLLVDASPTPAASSSSPTPRGSTA